MTSHVAVNVVARLTSHAVNVIDASVTPGYELLAAQLPFRLREGGEPLHAVDGRPDVVGGHGDVGARNVGDGAEAALHLQCGGEHFLERGAVREEILVGNMKRTPGVRGASEGLTSLLRLLIFIALVSSSVTPSPMRLIMGRRNACKSSSTVWSMSVTMLLKKSTRGSICSLRVDSSRVELSRIFMISCCKI